MGDTRTTAFIQVLAGQREQALNAQADALAENAVLRERLAKKDEEIAALQTRMADAVQDAGERGNAP